jgi:hypothetical protein
VVVWLNVRPRLASRISHIRFDAQEIVYGTVEYGCPWPYTSIGYKGDPSSLPVFRPYWKARYWPLTANIAIGLIAVAVLTFASRYLLRRMASGLKALFGKPPPANEESSQESR